MDATPTPTSGQHANLSPNGVSATASGSLGERQVTSATIPSPSMLGLSQPSHEVASNSQNLTTRSLANPSIGRNAEVPRGGLSTIEELLRDAGSTDPKVSQKAISTLWRTGSFSTARDMLSKQMRSERQVSGSSQLNNIIRANKNLESYRKEVQQAFDDYHDWLSSNSADVYLTGVNMVTDSDKLDDIGALLIHYSDLTEIREPARALEFKKILERIGKWDAAMEVWVNDLRDPREAYLAETKIANISGWAKVILHLATQDAAGGSGGSTAITFLNQINKREAVLRHLKNSLDGDNVEDKKDIVAALKCLNEWEGYVSELVSQLGASSSRAQTIKDRLEGAGELDSFVRHLSKRLLESNPQNQLLARKALQALDKVDALVENAKFIIAEGPVESIPEAVALLSALGKLDDVILGYLSNLKNSETPEDERAALNALGRMGKCGRGVCLLMAELLSPSKMDAHRILDCIQLLVEKSGESLPQIVVNPSNGNGATAINEIFKDGYYPENPILADFYEKFAVDLKPYQDLVNLGSLYSLDTIYTQADSKALEMLNKGQSLRGFSEGFVIEAWNELSLFTFKDAYEQLEDPIKSHISELMQVSRERGAASSQSIAERIKEGKPVYFGIGLSGHAMSASCCGNYLILNNMGGAFSLENGVLTPDGGQFAGKVIFDISDAREQFDEQFIQDLMHKDDEDGSVGADLRFQEAINKLYEMPIVGVVGKRGQNRSNCAFTHVTSGIFEDACLYEAYEAGVRPSAMDEVGLQNLGQDTTAKPYHRRYAEIFQRVTDQNVSVSEHPVPISKAEDQTVPIKGQPIPLLDSLPETRLARRVYRDQSLFFRVKALRDFVNNPNAIDLIRSALPEARKADAEKIAQAFVAKSCDELIRIIDKRAADKNAENKGKNWMEAGFNTLEIPRPSGTLNTDQPASIMQDLLLAQLEETPLGDYAKGYIQTQASKLNDYAAV